MRILILWLLLGAVALAQPITLQEACRKASQSSPTLRRLEKRALESLYRVDEAYAPGNPRADFTARYSHITPELNFGPFPLIVNDNYAFGITLEQAIFTFGRLKWGTQAAQLAHQATLQEVVRERQRIAYDTALTYSRLATASSAIRVAEERLKARRAFVHDLDLRVQAGSSARFEKLVAEVAVAEDQQKLLQAQQRASMLHDQVAVKLGLPLSRELELQELDVPSDDAVEPPVEKAFSQRPEMKALQFAIGAAEARVSFEESQNAPELGAMTRFEQRNSTAFQTSHQWMVGINLRVPLFDGGLTAARSNQARAALGQLQDSRSELERQILLELRQASSHVRLARERLAVARSHLQQALEARRLGELRFKAGVSTHQEVLDVQAHAAEAQLGLLEAQQAVREAQWEIAWVTSQSFPFAEEEQSR